MNKWINVHLINNHPISRPNLFVSWSQCWVGESVLFCLRGLMERNIIVLESQSAEDLLPESAEYLVSPSSSFCHRGLWFAGNSSPEELRVLPSKVRAESGICLACLLNWWGGTAQLWAGDHRDESKHGMVHINSLDWPYQGSLPRSGEIASQINRVLEENAVVW